MTRRAAALLGVLACVALVLGATGATGAPAPTTTGYWVKLGVALPTVPAGGLVVGDDPTEAVNPAQPPTLPISLPVAIPPLMLPGPQLFGFLAVSALRITGVDPTADVTLTLHVAQPSLPPLPSFSTIVACPIVNTSWSAATGGDISSAPASNCGTPSVGRLASDDATISFLLPVSYQSTPGELDVAFEPGSMGLPLPFLVAFQRPIASDIVTGKSAPPAASPSSVPAPVIAPSPETGAIPLPSIAALPPAAAPQAPTVALAPSVRQPSAQLPPVGRLAAVHLPRDDRAHRILAVALLFVVAGAWWWVSGRPGRTPRRLGGLDTTAAPGAPPQALGGVGRFRHPRTSSPPRL